MPCKAGRSKPSGIFAVCVWRFGCCLLLYTSPTWHDSLFLLAIRISLITNRIVINQSRRKLNVCVVKQGNWISGVILFRFFFLSPFHFQNGHFIEMGHFIVNFKWTRIDTIQIYGNFNIFFHFSSHLILSQQNTTKQNTTQHNETVK